MLASSDPYTYLINVVINLFDLALLHISENNYLLAEEELIESVSIMRRLVERSPENHNYNLSYNLYKLGYLFSITDRVEKALISYREAADICETIVDSEDNVKRLKCAIFSDMAHVYSLQKNYIISEQFCRQSLDLCASLSRIENNAKDYKLNFLYRRLGNILFDQNKFKEAEECYNESINISSAIYAKENSNENYSEMAETLSCMANLHKATGNYSEAQKEYSAIVDICRKLSISDSLYKTSLVIFLHELADMYSEHSSFFVAENTYNEALKLSLTLDNQDLQYRIYRSLTYFYYRYQKYQFSLEYADKTISILRQLIKENDFYRECLADILMLSGTILLSLDNFDLRAEKLCLEGLDILNEITSTEDRLNSANLAFAYLKLGEICYFKENYESSAEYHLNSFLIYSNIGEQERSAYIMKIIANCSLKLFNYDVAETQCKKALELFRSLECNYRDDINELLIHLGNISNRSKKYAIAEEYFKEALPLSLSIEDDVATILPDKLYENYCGLAICCRELNKEKEADKYLRKAISVGKKLKAKRPDLYTASLQILIDSVKNRRSLFSFIGIRKKS